jgi:hypothetical protein
VVSAPMWWTSEGHGRSGAHAVPSLTGWVPGLHGVVMGVLLGVQVLSLSPTGCVPDGHGFGAQVFSPFKGWVSGGQVGSGAHAVPSLTG